MARKRTILLVSLLALILVGAVGSTLVINRMATCGPVPFINQDLLPNANLLPSDDPQMPAGWHKAANGIELRDASSGFEYDHDGRALQLIGIGNFVQTPPIQVQPGRGYCFVGRALTDSIKHSPTRLRVAFDWRDAQGRTIPGVTSDWQPVVLWQPNAIPNDWSLIQAAFIAPPNATTLLVRLEPSSDDRVYLDAMHVRTSFQAQPTPPLAQTADAPTTKVAINPWPNGYRAALSFSFDWETAMGGLIHSRSDDPRSSENPLLRGMRMREGVTTTLALFEPHGIRATYYANGYNFLFGNTEHRQFMNNPTFAWADHSSSQKWPNDFWKTTPWFANDPYGTIQSDPAWYFGDLVARLQAAKQDIQSHTFSHLDAGLASTQEWQTDLAAWRELASERGVPSARSLAFPWSSSAGLSDNDWNAMVAAGITSVTRTKPGQPQYELASPTDPHCKPVPGHEQILACPDFYLHDQASADQALEEVDRTIAVNGTIDLWAHTEEVTTPEQIAAWRQVVAYAAQQHDAGALWIAPLSEITDWQRAIAQCQIEPMSNANQATHQPLVFKITNPSQHDLNGVTLTLPFRSTQLAVDGILVTAQTSDGQPVLDLPARQTLEVQVWPA